MALQVIEAAHVRVTCDACRTASAEVCGKRDLPVMACVAAIRKFKAVGWHNDPGAVPGPASEGRCQSDCLPSVQPESSELVQDVCSSGNLCAPYTDPFKGTSTGACTLACDSPKKPPFTFPRCCAYQGQSQGTCVPKSLVPASQKSELKQDVCPTNAASYLCVCRTSIYPTPRYRSPRAPTACSETARASASV